MAGRVTVVDLDPATTEDDVRLAVLTVLELPDSPKPVAAPGAILGGVPACRAGRL